MFSKASEAYAQGIRAGHINCLIDSYGECPGFGLEVFDPHLKERITNPYNTGSGEFRSWEAGEQDGYRDQDSYLESSE